MRESRYVVDRGNYAEAGQGFCLFGGDISECKINQGVTTLRVLFTRAILLRHWVLSKTGFFDGKMVLGIRR